MGGNELMTGWPFAHHGEEVAGNEPAVADGRPTRRRGGGAGCCRERRLPGAGRQDVSPQLIWARTRYQPGDPWPQARAETQGCSPSGSPAAFQSIGRVSSFKPQFSGGGPVLATMVAAEGSGTEWGRPSVRIGTDGSGGDRHQAGSRDA